MLAIKLDPAAIGPAAGYALDMWQVDALRIASTHKRVCCRVGRQSGKSFFASLMAVWELITNPSALVIIISPTLRQSSLLYKSCIQRFNDLGRPVGVVKQTELTLELSTGARLVSLPGGSPGSTRGFSRVSLLIEDEAAFCSDDVFQATRAFLAVSDGRSLLLSTPNGVQGHFYEACHSPAYHEIHVPTWDCPRVSSEFLEGERLSLGEGAYLAEYGANWGNGGAAVFPKELLNAAFIDYQPWGDLA